MAAKAADRKPQLKGAKRSESALFRAFLAVGQFQPVAEPVRFRPFGIRPIRLRQAAPRAGFSRPHPDRKSTRLNSSHSQISYAVFCLKKKTQADARLQP